MSFHHSHSPAARSSSIPSTYSFDELQDIWNLQKEILNKYKSSQVPFVILDQDNTGIISSKDFPYRLVARGFPCNTALYLKFFSFLDTNQDGFINLEDWIEGFKRIGERLVETRCKAREELKAASLIAHSRQASSVDGYSTTPAKYAQNSFDLSSQKSWATPKNIESNINVQSSPLLSQYNSINNNGNILTEPDDQMQRISLGLNKSNGRRFSIESHSSIQRPERKLQIDTSETHKAAATRINERVDNILKNIETRKNLLSGTTPKVDTVTPSSEFQNMFAGLRKNTQNGDLIQKSEDIHQSIKRSSADAIGAIRTKLGLDQSAKDPLGAYTPSVTSITGLEDEVPVQKTADTHSLGLGGRVLRKNSEEKEVQFAGIENSLQSKIRRSAIAIEREQAARLNTRESASNILSKKIASPQSSKRSLTSQSSASLVEEGLSHMEKVSKALSVKRKNNSQSIAIPPRSGSEKNLDTPSWKDRGELEEGAVLEMIENILEKYGSRDEALKTVKKEDLVRYPRLRMFVASLDERSSVNEKINRGRQFCNGVRKRSRTKSMIELRVKGDLVKEIEMEVQRRRAITPQISARYSSKNETPRPRTPDRIANAEKMIESLREFAEKSAIMKRKTRSQKVGSELAKEILEGKETRNGGLAIYNRVQEKLKGDKQAEEAKRDCKDVVETFGSRKREVKRSREDVLSNVGYSIQLDVAKNNFVRRDSEIARKEDNRGGEDDKRLQLRRTIDQLSNEAASMEASLSKSRSDLRKPLQESMESKQRLLKLMTPNNEVKVEKLLVPEKRRVKSFIRGSLSSTSSTNIGSDFYLNQSSVETKLMDRLNQTKPVNRYSKLASDLGALSVCIDNKPERKASSPFNGTRTSKNSSISVSSLLKEEFLGRGKSFLQADYSGMSSILKDLSTPLTTKSSIRVGFNKF